MVDLHSIPSPSEPAPAVGADLPPASGRSQSVPREWGLVGRYLPDPSLRYTRLEFAGPSIPRVVGVTLGFALGVLMVLVPSVQLAVSRSPSWWIACAIPGAALAFELFKPLRSTWAEVRHKLPFWWSIGSIDIGLERAVPQPGTQLRYEVHFVARRALTVQSLHVRLVFWEGWLSTRRLRWLRIPYRAAEKNGHDLVRHEVPSLHVPKGEHAIVRGAIPIPLARPSEHHRGRTRHMSYVNLTVTLVTEIKSGLHRGNCPHLITFPWI